MSLSPLPPDPFNAVEALPGGLDGGLLLICDHASNALPADYGDLGLSPAQFRRHIAYDIGAAAVTRRLAALSGAPALLTRTSRLLIDPNRGADDPTVLMRLSDGAVVPGNAKADAAERARRLDRYHRPYHAAIEATLDTMIARGTIPAIVSIHSFTPAWKGVPRPWHVGVLWDLDDRLNRPLIQALGAGGDLVVGDNEPYDGALMNDTLHTHGTRRGLAHTLIEIRQDLIADDASAALWAERLWGILEPLLRNPDLHVIRHFGSRAGDRVRHRA